MTLVNPGTTEAKTVRKTTVLDWFENMKCLSLSGCHFAVSQSWASYHTLSERRESELPADQTFFEFLPITSYFLAYFWDVPTSAKLTHNFVCHSVISCQISGYYTPRAFIWLQLLEYIWCNKGARAWGNFMLNSPSNLWHPMILTFSSISFLLS